MHITHPVVVHISLCEMLQMCRIKSKQTSTLWLLFIGIPVYTDKRLDIVEAGGVQIRGIKGRIIPRKKLQKEPVLSIYKFFPYVNLNVSFVDLL